MSHVTAAVLQLLVDYANLELLVELHSIGHRRQRRRRRGFAGWLLVLLQHCGRPLAVSAAQQLRGRQLGVIYNMKLATERYI